VLKLRAIKIKPEVLSLNFENQRREKGDRENGGSLGCGRKLVRQWNG